MSDIVARFTPSGMPIYVANAFAHYRDQGINRTYGNTAQHFELPLDRVRTWGVQYKWRYFVDQYDAMVNEEQLLEEERQEKEQIKRDRILRLERSRLLADMGMRVLHEKVEAQEVPASVALNMVREGHEGQRKDHGQVQHHVVDLNIDYSKLTIAELERLARGEPLASVTAITGLLGIGDDEDNTQILDIEDIDTDSEDIDTDNTDTDNTDNTDNTDTDNTDNE